MAGQGCSDRADYTPRRRALTPPEACRFTPESALPQQARGWVSGPATRAR